MLRTIPSSTPWSSSDCGNSGNGPSDNILDGGEEEELGERDGSTMMTSSQITRKEINFKDLKCTLRNNHDFF